MDTLPTLPQSRGAFPLGGCLHIPRGIRHQFSDFTLHSAFSPAGGFSMIIVLKPPLGASALSAFSLNGCFHIPRGIRHQLSDFTLQSAFSPAGCFSMIIVLKLLLRASALSAFPHSGCCSTFSLHLLCLTPIKKTPLLRLHHRLTVPSIYKQAK